MDNFAIIGFWFLIFGQTWATSEGSCYFPQEFQGEFKMQISASVVTGVQYSSLNITENSIPIWGNCHRRIGNNFILMLNYSDTSCIRCLHLKLRSANVLQVFVSSDESISKCFTNEEYAEASCPLEESLSTRKSTEILLFKIRDNIGQYTTKEYCPIDGKYHLNYKGPYSIRTANACYGYSSTVDSCPSGSTLNLRLRNCTFDNYDIKFDCLGYWKDTMSDQTFLIFVDNRHGTNKLPQYRCAVYKQTRNGTIYMALSSDSTCVTDLHNSTGGFETFVLMPKEEKPWPVEVSLEVCSFPKWMYGDWEHVRVKDDTMIYKDHSSFKTYTIKCVGVIQDSDKYWVFQRTQCDEESYGCIRIANRSNNILEFQIGSNHSESKEVYELCAEGNFKEDSWITQGRTDILPGQSTGMCPITGEYTGVIPDATDLCAKLWSDCRAPELMYYQVSHCESQEIYEEREYQCLGHWREGNLLYTYTERKDVAAGTYECFVGSISSDSDIYIKEAGEHCQRNIDPFRYGMKLRKKQPLYSCIERSTPKHVVHHTTQRTLPTYPTTPIVPRRTTASQDFDTNEIPKSIDDTTSSSLILNPYSCLFVITYAVMKYY